MAEVTIIRSNGEIMTLDVMQSAEFAPDIVVAEHPIDPGSAGGAATVIDSVVQRGLPFTVNGIVSAHVFGPGGEPNREQRAVDFLRSIVGELVTVVLPKFRPVTNCLLAAYPHSIDSKSRTPFSLSFRQNDIATATVVVLPKIAPRAKATLDPPEDVGEQPTRPAGEKVTQEVSSALIDLGRGAKRLVFGK